MTDSLDSPVDGCFFRPLPSPHASATWEITNRCSLHCVHCCTEARAKGLPDELDFDEAKAGIDYLYGRWAVREIYFSGGEPFERRDFLDLCDYAASIGMRLSVASAGLPIDASVAHRVAGLPFDFVHISLDSAEESAHDRFRGFAGSFRAAVGAIDNLIAQGVEVRVGTVVSQLNCNELDAVARLCLDHRVRRLNFILMLDAGRARRTHSLNMMLEPELREFAEAEIEELAVRYRGVLDIDCRRTKSTATEPLARCPGAVRLFHVDARGNIWPCSWIAKLLPEFSLGNLRSSEPIPDERQRRYQSFLDSRSGGEACAGCPSGAMCGRGCPIAALLYARDAMQRDPLCDRTVGFVPSQVLVQWEKS